MPKTIEGVLTAIVTPFTATGSLNIPALKVQVNRQLKRVTRFLRRHQRRVFCVE